MIDTHAHLYDEFFMPNIQHHVDEIKSAGVKEVWLPNCDFESWNALRKLASNYPEFCLPMIGLHPTYVKENYKEELSMLKSALDNNHVLAIGEIGLDYYWDISFMNEQKEAFETQCQWALDHTLWIDVHCRKAYADLIKLLKSPSLKEIKGIIHCFSGDQREAKTLVDLGFLLGIGGVITYKNSTLFNDIKDIPLEYIVLETDAPYLSPVPFRGQQNSPKNIQLIAQKLADLYEVSCEDLVQITSNNAMKLKEYSNYQ